MQTSEQYIAQCYQECYRLTPKHGKGYAQRMLDIHVEQEAIRNVTGKDQGMEALTVQQQADVNDMAEAWKHRYRIT